MKKKGVEKISKLYNITGVIVLFLGFILILVPTIPYIWYIINPEATTSEINTLVAEVIPEKDIAEIPVITDDKPLPPLDPNLAKENFVLIDKIKVYSPIQAGEDYIEALKRGSWIVPEFGDPINSDKPIILASHRFGYSSWSTDMRQKISFYNLPSTTQGDIIKILWDQRIFEYEIYKLEESSYITDYNADLILYTCKFFNSPIRIFRYAKAIN